MKSIKSKKPTQIVDSRNMKILAAKKDELKDAVVWVCLDDEKFGFYDVAQLRRMADVIDKIEPDAYYFLSTKQLKVNIYDKAEFKNRDIVITVGHESDMSDMDSKQIEERFELAFADARSIKFVHHYAEDIS